MSSGDNFHIYLPSSVKNSVIENKISHYITELNTPLMLDPNLRYEAALIYISYPRSVHNISDGFFNYYSPTFETIVGSNLPSGLYTGPEQLIQAFKTAMDPDDVYYHFGFNETSHKMYVTCKPFSGLAKPFLEMSSNLQSTTGFKGPINKLHTTVGAYSYDFQSWSSNFYIYTNLIDHVAVGDIHSPLLAIIAYKPSGLFAQQVQHEISNPVYVPIRTNVIKTIEIEILNKASVHIPFSSGELVCLIHVRKIV